MDLGCPFSSSPVGCSMLKLVLFASSDVGLIGHPRMDGTYRQHMQKFQI